MTDEINIVDRLAEATPVHTEYLEVPWTVCRESGEPKTIVQSKFGATDPMSDDRNHQLHDNKSSDDMEQTPIEPCSIKYAATLRDGIKTFLGSFGIHPFNRQIKWLAQKIVSAQHRKLNLLYRGIVRKFGCTCLY